jgi:hypothetical protein
VSSYGTHRSQFRRVSQPQEGSGNAYALKIESIEFVFEGYTDSISRKAIMLERVHRYVPSSDPALLPEHSPTRSRPPRKASYNKRAQSGNHDEATLPVDDESPAFVTFETARVPPVPVNAFGLTEMAMRCLEVRAVMNQRLDEPV